MSYFGSHKESWGFVFLIFGIICGVVGWMVIELLIWLFSHITISWGE